MSIDAVTDRQIALNPSRGRQNSWRLRASWLVMLLTDAVALQLCVFLAYLTRLALSPVWPMDITPDQYRPIALGVLMIPAAFQIMGFYPGYGTDPVKRLRQRVLTTVAIFAVLTTWALVQRTNEWAVSLMVLTAAFALVLPWIFESGMRDLLVRLKLWGQPVVILGTGDAGRRMLRTLKARPETGYRPIALFDEDANEWGRTYEGVRVEGSFADANEWSGRGVNTALLATHDIDGSGIAAMAERTRFETLLYVPNLFGMQSAWITPVDFRDVPGLAIRNNLRSKRAQVLKRILDYIVIVPATIAALPIIGLAALAIRLVDGGPVFFIHRRRGLDGKPIDVLKIRTMYKDADRRLEELLKTNPEAKAEWDRFLKLRNDPRVLPGVGGILRKFSLDELPQLFNILKGDMTLVGPRPFPDYHLDQFDDSFRTLRQSVVPGLTGLWQVSERSEGDLEVQQRQDTYYIRNWSIWLDIYILMRTVLIVLGGKGAY